ncbi:hypothetical protein [Pseudomonas leptonychotis]|uniref:hypothetical protein n=1 Tax=Pseudomonas leptonychotis TaxID=2448482 RepID=UPI0039F0DA8C
MKMDWKQLEGYVRDIASVIWRRAALPERIEGVNFDAVVRVSDDEIILIEITRQFSLDKVREDIAKIKAVKLNFSIKDVFARAYIVLGDEPTPGMVELGLASKVKVVSVSSFIKEAFDYSSYVNMRRRVEFGSAINPSTGEPDQHAYVPVSYLDEAGKKKFTVQDICSRLERGDKIALLGEYGTGKSRCTKEVFDSLSKRFGVGANFVFAINLREHWGAASAIEIIAGHLKRLGLSDSIDRAMQLLMVGKITLILDGFDEVGSQTFGGSQDQRVSIRKFALQGIRDLIANTTGGVLVTGRPHYFNSNKEMFDCLGLSVRSHSSGLLRCATEFDVVQAKSYLENIGVVSDVPQWLPRKPLMFLILAQIDISEANKILSGESGEIGFWGQFIDTVCLRESKIHTSIDPASVRDVLTNLAVRTRLSDRELGRLTPNDVNKSYEDATGVAPDESGQLMLSRLCTLGRIEPESPDRQFVDPYIVQLLFAESLANDVSEKKYDILDVRWRQSLNEIGLYFLAQWIDLYGLERDAVAMINRQAIPVNGQVVGELVAALMLTSGDVIDYGGLHVSGAEIPLLLLGGREVSNIFFDECIINVLSFDVCKIDKSSSVVISKPYILMATGLTSSSALPDWVTDYTIQDTQSASNASRIKSSNLPPSQKLFLSIIQKIFFQRGGGRKESSLFKGGFGQQYDRRLIEQILHVLVSDGFVDKSKDVSGAIYNPRREFTPRMRAIRDQLGLSKDPLWLKVSAM